MEHKIRARVIIEMLGSPKEHIVETLKDYVSQLRQDKTLKLVSEHIAEPEARDGKLYSVFTELDLWFKDLSHLIAFCFDALPSSIEILEPENISMKAKDFEGILNDLQAKLHSVDLAIKKLRAANTVLDTNAMNIFRNFVIYALKQPKTLQELSTVVGMPSDKLTDFLAPMLKENKIKKTGNTYSS
jgi:hypothetical protein